MGSKQCRRAQNRSKFWSRRLFEPSKSVNDRSPSISVSDGNLQRSAQADLACLSRGICRRCMAQADRVVEGVWCISSATDFYGRAREGTIFSYPESCVRNIDTVSPGQLGQSSSQSLWLSVKKPFVHISVSHGLGTLFVHRITDWLTTMQLQP